MGFEAVWKGCTCGERLRGPEPRRSSRPAALFLFHGALRRRNGLEPLVRNRLSALDGQPEGPVREALLGPLDSGERRAQVIRDAFVELFLVEVGSEVRRVEIVVRLAVVVAGAAPEGPLDSRALGRQQLPCPVGVHEESLRHAELCEAPLEEAPLGVVLHERQRTPVGLGCLCVALQAAEEVGAGRVQVEVIVQLEALDELERLVPRRRRRRG
jgi:hypothetical protein